uniref:Integrase p58-like C-terminal domain-containing protein n=1 Tax=Amphimedon queenslandica TaxID=400682 RepID=A0A1X7V9A3_AMPQE
MATAKLHHPWTGPFVIMDKVSDLNYKIKFLNATSAKPLIVHFNRLQLCVPGTRFQSPLVTTFPAPSTYHVGEGATIVEDGNGDNCNNLPPPSLPTTPSVTSSVPLTTPPLPTLPVVTPSIPHRYPRRTS